MTNCSRLILLTVLAGILLSSVATPCINIHATDLQGNDIYRNVGDDPTQGLRHDPDQAAHFTTAVELAAVRAAESPTLENRSDYAACLIRTGELEQAIQLLLALEAEFPENYAVAGNLGTAFELSGDNSLALHWIEQGIARNPRSHHGSEWVHVEILKAKIRHESNADPQAHLRVLSVDFGSEPLPVTPAESALEQYGVADLDQLLLAIQYQLQERVQFVPAPDPVVADLMFTLAELVALRQSVEESLAIYEIADEYGYPDRLLLQSRMTELDRVRATNLRSGLNDTHAALGFLAFIVVAAFAIVFVVAAVGIMGFLFWGPVPALDTDESSE